MKKIAFFTNKFVAGGLEKSLLELINVINPDEYEIIVFLPNKDGEWTSLLEKKARVVVLEQEESKLLIKKYLKNLNLIKLLKLFIFRVKAVISTKRNYFEGLTYRAKSMSEYPEKFDVAIAYQAVDVDSVLNCLYRVNSTKKILWVHQHFFNSINPFFYNWYAGFDKVFCVSKNLKNHTTTKYPKLDSKTDVFYNIINPDIIKKQADEYHIDLKTSEAQTVLVTVGRISKEKGQVVIPQVADMLLKKGYSFIWYLVGEGPAENDLKEKINQYGVSDNVVLCGRRDNPYPYIKNCDIYVQTSKEEGWGLTVSEAKILNRPIVTTDAGVMSEQIETGINGIITKNDSAEEICNEIERLIVNPDLRKSFTQALETDDAKDNKKEINKLYSFIG